MRIKNRGDTQKTKNKPVDPDLNVPLLEIKREN